MFSVLNNLTSNSFTFYTRKIIFKLFLTFHRLGCEPTSEAVIVTRSAHALYMHAKSLQAQYVIKSSFDWNLLISFRHFQCTSITRIFNFHKVLLNNTINESLQRRFQVLIVYGNLLFPWKLSAACVAYEFGALKEGQTRRHEKAKWIDE